MVNHARPYSEDLFIIIGIHTINLRFADLIKPVAIDAEAQLLWHHFISCSKVSMYGFARLEINLKGDLISSGKLIVLIIPEVM